MVEIKENMYIRTNNGNIRKITELVNSEYIDEPDYYVDKVLIDIVQDDKTEDTIYMEKWLFDENIIKSSYNIIDLIEVGDYVNGYEIVKVEKDYIYFEDGSYYCKNYQIKSIVTKEMYSSVEYRVENN